MTCEGLEIKVGKHFPPGFRCEVCIVRVYCLRGKREAAAKNVDQKKEMGNAKERRTRKRHTSLRSSTPK